LGSDVPEREISASELELDLAVFVFLDLYTLEAAESLERLVSSRALWIANVELWDFGSVTRTGVLHIDIDLCLSVYFSRACISKTYLCNDVVQVCTAANFKTALGVV